MNRVQCACIGIFLINILSCVVGVFFDFLKLHVNSVFSKCGCHLSTRSMQKSLILLSPVCLQYVLLLCGINL